MFMKVAISVAALLVLVFNATRPCFGQEIIGHQNVCKGETWGYGISGSYTTCNDFHWTTNGGSGSLTAYDLSGVKSVSVEWIQVGTWTLFGDASSTIGCSDPFFHGSIVVHVLDKPNPPTISKDNSYSEICSNDTWTFTSTESGYPTNYGYDWFTSSGLLVNGVSASSGSPLHTTSNSVTITPGSAYGPSTVSVRMNNTTDCPSEYVSSPFQVGPYNSNQFSISGPSSGCPNQVLDFTSSYINSDITDYQWSVPGGWSYSGQGTPYFHVTLPFDFSGGAVTLRLQNRCGLTGSPAVNSLYSSGCFAPIAPSDITAYPNPVTSKLEISTLGWRGEKEPNGLEIGSDNVELLSL